MSYRFFGRIAVVGLALCGFEWASYAQTVSATAPGVNKTSGIVGVTGGQTLQLNVLNLEPVIPGVTAVACPATLEIFDNSGALLKSMPVTNIPPASAASLVFKPAVPTTSAMARALVRGVVFVPANNVTPPPSPTSIPPGTSIVSLSVAVPLCNVMASFEVIDDATGETHSFTTDFRAMGPSVALAVPSGN
jgi:hypothetical protein